MPTAQILSVAHLYLSVSSSLSLFVSSVSKSLRPFVPSVSKLMNPQLKPFVRTKLKSETIHLLEFYKNFPIE